jgi:hypothetical protein
MFSQDDVQRILDHFHVGKVIRFEYWAYYCEVETSKGIFYVLWDLPSVARETEKDRKKVLTALVGKIERLLLSDYQDKKSEDVSYVHQRGKYYSVYKLIK